MNKENENKNLNVSGSFQIVDSKRKEGLIDVDRENELDEETLIYARQFMED